jgi:HK97 family phage prohead protease
MIRLTAQSVTIDAAANQDTPSRTISGIAAPYGISASVSTGQTIKINAGALPEDGPAPRLIVEHDTKNVVGIVSSRVSTDAGMLFTAQIAETQAGNDLLALLKMGALDSVSVGIEATDYEMDGSTMVVKAATWKELSVVYEPAFSGAVITQIAASEPEDDEPQPQESTEENPVSTESTPAPVVEAAVVPTNVIYASPAKPERLPSAAEYISAVLQGGTALDAMKTQLKAAAPYTGVSDDPGLLPVELTSPVYNGLIGRRPVIDAIGASAMPALGSTFRVPYVSTHNSVAQQSANFDTLQASLYGVSSYDITKLTFGGYVSVSEQLMDWSSPEVVGSLLDDMSRVYAYETDNYAADQLLAGCTQSQVLTDPTSPSEWVSDIYDATVTIINNSLGNVPTHLFVSPNMFGYLGKLVDTTGRPLLAPNNPMNAYGQMTPTQGQSLGNAFGLTVVVDRGFAADTVILGDPSGYKIWEQQKGAISVDAPSTLSRTLAFRGYLAVKMVDATKFVKIT